MPDPAATITATSETAVPPTGAAGQRRAHCPRCLLAQRACLCAAVRVVRVATEVLILQHPFEVAQAKNSARLLHLCLPGSRIEVGEQFDPAWLASLLAEGAPPLLLYPEESAGPGAPPAQEGKAGTAAGQSARRLVLLDATWRKSRKMLYLNPLLAALPRLALAPAAPSLYAIRKAHAPHQLSTLEAAALAIAQLEPGAPVQPLFEAMQDFVAQRQAFKPPRA